MNARSRKQLRDAIVRDPLALRAALDDIVASGDESTRAALKRAIGPAVKSMRSEAQAAKKARRREREIELGRRQASLPNKRYGLIVADPEWEFLVYSIESGMDRAAANHYPTSDLQTLLSRDVGSLAAPDCILFLWTTAPFLVEALCCLDAWGFAVLDRDQASGFLMPKKSRARYVSHFAWVKPDIITGYWNRGKHEILIVATRGKPVAPAMGEQLPSAVEAASSVHSAKPELFLEWIERQWPTTPKIELNRRGPARPGWAAWGNEVALNDASVEQRSAA